MNLSFFFKLYREGTSSTECSGFFFLKVVVLLIKEPTHLCFLEKGTRVNAAEPFMKFSIIVYLINKAYS